MEGLSRACQLLLLLFFWVGEGGGGRITLTALTGVNNFVTLYADMRIYLYVVICRK